MQNAIKMFKGSINDMEYKINTWTAENNFLILNTSMCYDDAVRIGHVFSIVVYTAASK